MVDEEYLMRSPREIIREFLKISGDAEESGEQDEEEHPDDL